MARLRALGDVGEQHDAAVLDYSFEWRDDSGASEDERRRPCGLYRGAVFERPFGFTMLKEDEQPGGVTETYKVGDYVTVNVPSVDVDKGGAPAGESESEPGDATNATPCGAANAATGNVAGERAEHRSHRGHLRGRARPLPRGAPLLLEVGQIHVNADRHFATRPGYSAQIWLQEEHLAKPVVVEGELSTNAIRRGDGTFRDVFPAIVINHLATVVTRREAEASPGGLQGFEARPAPVHRESGARDDLFWFDEQMTFDHSSYVFAERRGSGADAPPPLRLQGQPVMADCFCGLGTVALSASDGGFDVAFGLDSSRTAISSFRDNTADLPGPAPRFNRSGLPVHGFHMRAEEAAAELLACKREGRPLELRTPQGPRGLPHVNWMHASPPCQMLSSKKKIELRRFDGAELRAVVQLVEALQPEFFTLEEVPGFLVQRFAPGNLVGPLAGWPSAPPAGAADGWWGAAPGAAPPPGDGDSGDDASEQGLEDVDLPGGGDEQDRPEGAAGGPAGSVAFNPCLLVVSQLLRMGYQLRLTLLNAADYGCPQTRWRAMLMAAKRGYQLPEPPARRYKRAGGRPPILASDPGLMPGKKEGTNDLDRTRWFAVLELPEQGRLLEHVSLAEAIGDLPPLLPDQDDPSSAPPTDVELLGEPVCPYVPQMGVAPLRVQLGPRPGQQQQQQQPCPEVRVLSRFSRYMRSPHSAHHAHRLGSSFKAALLRDHTVRLRRSDVANVLAKKVQATGGAGSRRPAADGIGACVLGHNEPQPFCLHFMEDRYWSTLERRRMQGIPDWVVICGSEHQRQGAGDDASSKDRQVGNAVPGLLAGEVAACVWRAATGEEAEGPPELVGPCEDGAGAADAAGAAAVQSWYEDVGFEEAVGRSKRLLAEDAKAMARSAAARRTPEAAAAASAEAGDADAEAPWGAARQQRGQQAQRRGRQRRQPGPPPLLSQAPATPPAALGQAGGCREGSSPPTAVGEQAESAQQQRGGSSQEQAKAAELLSASFLGGQSGRAQYTSSAPGRTACSGGSAAGVAPRAASAPHRLARASRPSARAPGRSAPAALPARPLCNKAKRSSALAALDEAAPGTLGSSQRRRLEPAAPGRHLAGGEQPGSGAAAAAAELPPAAPWPGKALAPQQQGERAVGGQPLGEQPLVEPPSAEQPPGARLFSKPPGDSR